MDGILLLLAGGFVLGLAGSIHCACMCGGIASGALFILNPATPRQRVTTLLLLQAGRIATYTLAGGAVAAVTSLTIDPAATALSYKLLQGTAAAGLMWLGLSTSGLLPRLPVPAAGPAVFGPLLKSIRPRPVLGPLTLGLTWGLTPCPMVYAALFSAALMNSFFAGALWMLAFGIGTLPGVVSAALGLFVLSRIRRSTTAEVTAGLLIAVFGFSTVYFGQDIAGILCLTR